MKIKKYLQFINEGDEFATTAKPPIFTESEKFRYNNMIDYTLLEESATNEDIIELCKKANALGVKSVCILPKMVTLAAHELADSKVLVCTVIDFPKGTGTAIAKLNECEHAISDGADEIDMVLNYQMLKKNLEDGNKELIYEVKNLAHKCHDNKNKEGRDVILKVIVESGLLTNDETEMATYICLDAGADFIKTSTGKVSFGAELGKVKIMHQLIKEDNSNMKIKVSGGIRTIEQINQFMPYASRFGMGYASVDQINGITGETKSSY